VRKVRGKGGKTVLIPLPPAVDRAPGEAPALDGLGTLETCLSQPDQATQHHQQAVTMFRETGYREGEACALNGLGEAAHAASRPADARAYHTTADTIAADIGAHAQQARAHTGLGYAHHTLGDPTLALASTTCTL
jgi:hypothetical protein